MINTENKSKHIFPPQITDPGQFEQLATSTQILTSVPQELTPDNITKAAEITDRLLNSTNITEVPKKVAKSLNLQKNNQAKDMVLWHVVLKSPTFLQNTKVAAIATVSQLLSANATDNDKQRNATLR